MKTYKIKLLITALAVAGFAQVAPAPPSFPTFSGLYLYDEATGIGASVADVGGVAAFIGSVGDYSVNISATGVTLSGGSFPSLDLDVALAAAGPGATKLDIFYSDGTFGPTTGTYTLLTLGPNNGGPVVSSAYMGTNFFDQTVPLGGSTDAFPLTINSTGSINSSSYYLTLADVITGSEAGVDSFFTVTSVPEPTNLMAIALVLIPLGIGAKRLLRKGSAT
jgi:hypothetical protein